MEEYTDDLKQYLKGKRDFTKIRYKIAGTIYRGVTKQRFTYDEGKNAMKAGVTNVNNQ